MDNKKIKQIIKKEEYILYILNKLSAKTDKYRINKIAFLIEFAYLYKNHKELTNAEYAAIIKGPVINNYNNIFKDMEIKGLIKIDGYMIRPMKDVDLTNLDPKILEFVDVMIERFSKFNTNDLIALTHSLDSYNITTKDEKIMGNIIDKSLANLDIYFDDNLESYEVDQIPTNQLPVIDRSELVEYDLD